MLRKKGIQKIFDNIYAVLLISIAWFIGLLIGLGIFSLIPTTIVGFKIAQEKDEKMMRSVKVFFQFWWKTFKIIFKKNWKVSISYIGLMVVFIINYLFLKMTTSFIGYLLFYITIFLFLFVQIVFLWVSYIRAKYPELSVKEMIRNALLIPGSRLIEMIIYTVLTVALYMLLIEFIPGLVIFIGTGLGIMLTNWTFSKIIEGHGLNNFNLIWKRMH
jgi:uncharacterized membrane protein YesL